MLFRSKLLFVGLALLAAPAQAAVGDPVTTNKKILSQVLIDTQANPGFYYIEAVGGWGVSNCSQALYAYISRATPGADAILAAVLTAKASGTPLGFGGICGHGSGNPQYIQIRTAYF